MIPVVFEDSEILVLDKPPNLVTTSSETQSATSLEDILKKDYQIIIKRGGVVHRLDKDTSGVIIVAKTQESLENLQAQFKDRKTNKEYLALVHGRVESEGKINSAIMRHPGDREKFTTIDQLGHRGSWLSSGEANAKEAVTEYNPDGNFKFSVLNFQYIFYDLNTIQKRKLERMKYNEFTLLSCHPLTGRTHQIRVHLKYLGFPIVADEKYGGRKIVRLDHRWCPRQFLHAKSLEINHPKTGEKIKFESKLPEDLEKALNLLEKYD